MAKTLPERRQTLFNRSIRIMLVLTVKYRKQDKSICIYIVESKFVKLTPPPHFVSEQFEQLPYVHKCSHPT